MSIDRLIYCPDLQLSKLYDFIHIFDNKATQNKTDIGDRFIHYINFNFYGEDRMLTIMDLEINSVKAKKRARDEGWEYSETDDYQQINYNKLPDKTKGLRLSIKLWGLSDVLMKLICYRFGGYYLENDSTETEYKKIDPNYRKIIKEVL